MIRAFVFLTFRSWKNRLLWRFKRLREPRYAISAIVAIGYFGFLFFRKGGPAEGSRSAVERMSVDFVSVLPLALFVLAWLAPQHSALEFSEGERQFLFTGPLTRRQVLLYKLIRVQPQLLLSVLLMSFFGVPNGGVIGLWIAMNAANLYMTFVALAKPRLQMFGLRPWMQTILAIAAAIAIASLFWFQIGSFRDGDPFGAPALRSVLFVPSLFARLLFAHDPLVIAGYGAVVAAIGAAFFFAAAALRVPFEEIATVASDARAARRDRQMRRVDGNAITFKRMPPLFRLRPGAGPELAIFWKNLIASLRISALWLVVMLVVFAALFVQAMVTNEASLIDTISGIVLFLTALFPLWGSAMFPQDFRLDITRIDLLKGWPVRADRIVLGELAAPLVIVSLVELLMLVGVQFIVARSSNAQLAIFTRPEALVIALLFAVPVCAAQLVIRNAALLYFPAWMLRSKEDQRGMIMTGQRLMVMFANLLFLGLVLAPATLLCILGFFIAKRTFGGGPGFLALAITPAVAVLILEVWGGVKLIASRFETIDPSDDVQGTMTS